MSPAPTTSTVGPRPGRPVGGPRPAPPPRGRTTWSPGRWPSRSGRACRSATAWRNRSGQHRPARPLGLRPAPRPVAPGRAPRSRRARPTPGRRPPTNRWAATSSSKRMTKRSSRSAASRPGLGGQELLDLGHRVVEPVDHGVDLGPQAGRQQHRLLEVRPVAQRAQHLGEVVLGDRRPARAGRAGPGGARALRRRRTTGREPPRWAAHARPPGDRVRFGPRADGTTSRPCAACSSGPAGTGIGTGAGRPIGASGSPSIAGADAGRSATAPPSEGPAAPAGSSARWPAGLVEAHHLELDRQVDVAQQHVGRARSAPGGRS